MLVRYKGQGEVAKLLGHHPSLPRRSVPMAPCPEAVPSRKKTWRDLDPTYPRTKVRDREMPRDPINLLTGGIFGTTKHDAIGRDSQ